MSKFRKISEDDRDGIIKYLDVSNLPHSDVKALVTLLIKLEEIPEMKIEGNLNSPE